MDRRPRVRGRAYAYPGTADLEADEYVTRMEVRVYEVIADEHLEERLARVRGRVRLRVRGRVRGRVRVRVRVRVRGRVRVRVRGRD